MAFLQLAGPFLGILVRSILAGILILAAAFDQIDLVTVCLFGFEIGRVAYKKNLYTLLVVAILAGAIANVAGYPLGRMLNNAIMVGIVTEFFLALGKNQAE